MNRTASPDIVIYWFRNDLRLHDQPVLSELCETASELLPVYCLDPRWFVPHELGFPKSGSLRTQFLLESLEDLREQLREAQSDLLVYLGKPEEVLPELARQLKAGAVYAEKEHAHEELTVERALVDALDVPLRLHEGRTLILPNSLPFSIEQLPDIYTQFRKKAEKYGDIAPLGPRADHFPLLPQGVEPEPLPTLAELGLEPQTPSDKGVMPFKGGEGEGLRRLHEYIWQRELVKTYKKTRNGLLGEAYSSKFSPWLALGALSPRKIHAEVKQFEQEVVSNSSTYWLIFELLWRDYFRFVTMKYGRRLFFLQGIKDEAPTFRNRMQDFEAWRMGETGEPFVDANMKELLLTGFMSNRGRQNVASYLCKDLSVDWRWGAAWFESQLIDYDVCSNWGNWTYVAGVGNDPRPHRYFNVRKQAERYDPQGEYVSHWLDSQEVS